ncbi:glycosyltransferase family 4 protein [Parabacteroides sp. ZJ-118]|uniref:glycosyltransferase family 4 protein n=1 Tax=Parabacteroides sp. ZJ-118 TaxID=2709398 RepID=UPI0013EE29CC|nr:glycosyltransferase family 4 protein [Parabacteroides sp. ZJ-118]
MKIVILANSDAGLLSFRQELIEALILRGHNVTVSLPQGDRLDEITALGCRLDIATINRRGTNPIADFQLFRYYRQLLNRLKPDVVLTYTIKPNIYGGLACAMKGIPYIVNITGLGSAVEKPGMLQKLTVNLYRLAMRKADCIFFQNKGNQGFFERKNINRDVHRLIPGSGANIHKFTVAPYPASEPVKFLYISRIMKEKGIEEYFAAARHFRKLHKEVEFHILGDCEENYAVQLQALANEGVVVYHGQQKDVRPYLAEASCLIHPTFYPEGMSNVILEAASSGRPVITTRRHGCMEAVDDGETGFLFAERDTKGLLDAIDKFLALTIEQRAEMGRRARVKMEKEFDRTIVVNAYLEEIEKAKR